MKKLIVAAIAGLMVLASCQSTKPILGFTTAAYVDEQLTAAKQASEADIQALTLRLDVYADKIDRLDALLADVDAYLADAKTTKDKVSQLEGLADLVEDRLASMPRETIAAIVEILKAYVESGKTGI